MTTDARRGAAEQALQTWQNGWRALFGGVQRQLTAIGVGAADAGTEQQASGSALERIAASTQALGLAQLDVAAEWLRLPLALTQPGSTAGLTASYGRLIEAYGQVFAAYVSAAAPLQMLPARSAERAGRAAEAAVEAQTEALQKSATAVERESRAVIEAPAAAVQPAEATGRQSAPGANNGAQAAAEPQIRGKITREGERIYHLPGQANYDRVDPDMLFESEEAARAAGFRPSQR
ncbi:MAG TPA: hypothetical protein VKV26_19530 [Dehalococcoidia bacterium]|nr:hypothetical protein [Dehalococcoidia bacterium]